MKTSAELKAESVKYIPKDYDADLYRIRHSAAHVMAQAVLEIYPNAQLAIGPPTEAGFYYDFDLPDTPTDEILAKIEKRMRGIIAAKHPFEVKEVSADEARQMFAPQKFKVELIDNLAKGKLDDDGNPLTTAEPATITVYQQDKFIDLCRGPHVEHTGKIPQDGFKLLNVTGAYWRGDEKREQLKRIYATAWKSKKDLEDYLHRLEEAKKRDHRKLGKELELFTINELSGAGFPLWLPRGATIRRILEDFIVELERQDGYQHVYSSPIGRVDLYKISGHWDHYQKNMFPPMELDHETLVLRPMNCPHHIMIFDSTKHSYRELPIRIAEMGTMFRYEKSGAVSGLSRVRGMCLNDAHIFCRADQVKEEFSRVVRLVEKAYKCLGITEYSYRLSLRDPEDKESYVQNDEMWNLGERQLRESMDELGLPYKVAPGEAAFYGPKLDIQLRDVMGREETISTVQIDFHLPNQFKLGYIDQDDSETPPVIIHRGVISTMERMTAYLIEHYAGAFPVWLAPMQVTVVPIADRHFDYCSQVANDLVKAGFRADCDLRERRMNAKIRDAQLLKTPYILVVGDKEMEMQGVAVRLRNGGDLGAMPLAQFQSLLRRIVETKSLQLTEDAT
jgi:threonyl-tRNA synthetase